MLGVAVGEKTAARRAGGVSRGSDPAGQRQPAEQRGVDRRRRR